MLLPLPACPHPLWVPPPVSAPPIEQAALPPRLSPRTSPRWPLAQLALPTVLRLLPLISHSKLTVLQALRTSLRRPPPRLPPPTSPLTLQFRLHRLQTRLRRPGRQPFPIPFF